jgi:hypothetical protein
MKCARLADSFFADPRHGREPSVSKTLYVKKFAGRPDAFEHVDAEDPRAVGGVEDDHVVRAGTGNDTGEIVLELAMTVKPTPPYRSAKAMLKIAIVLPTPDLPNSAQCFRRTDSEIETICVRSRSKVPRGMSMSVAW